MARRVEAVRIERARLAGELEALGLSVAPSEANLLWLGRRRLRRRGARARARDRAKIRVAEGGRFGDPGRIRVAVQDEAAGDRLRDALAAILRG